MFDLRAMKRNKYVRAAFITVTVLIAVGLVIPIAGLFQPQPDNYGVKGDGPGGMTLEERMADLEGRAKEEPDNTEVLMGLAETYFYSGKPEQAVETYGRLLSLEPGHAEARLDLATIHFYTGKFEQATEQLQELIERHPDNKEAYYLYGIVLGAGKKDYAAGIVKLEQFINLAGAGLDVERARQIIEEWKGLQEVQQSGQ